MPCPYRMVHAAFAARVALDTMRGRTPVSELAGIPKVDPVLQVRLAASWHRLINLCVKTTRAPKSYVRERATFHPDIAARTG
jgi:hypothetical protein